MSLYESTAATRELGGELLRRREAAGLLGIDLAHRTGWSASKISRLESGHGSYSEVTVTAYLAHCGVSAREIAEVLKAADHQHTGYLARRDVMRSLIVHESTATAITVNATLLVPGLLQTEDYARAVVAVHGDAAPEEIERRVKVRMDRQALLHRLYRPSFRFLIGENLLRTLVGSRQIMHEQVLQLVFASSRPKVEVRVVPAARGAIAAVTGYFTLMEFADHAPVIFVEGDLGGLLVEEREIVAKARAVERKIVADALDVEQSREFLARMASQYD